MNQILEIAKETNSNNDKYKIKNHPKTLNKHKKKNFLFYKFQFAFSVFLIFCTISSFALYKLYLKNQESATTTLLNNYNVYRLYSNSNITEKQMPSNDLFGIINIPKINLYYPVFSNLTEEKLKVSVCKFYGGSFQDFSNICIAGHNYDNSMFFSNIYNLDINDDILFYDNLGNQYIYSVFDKYEVSENDLSPIFDYNKSFKQLTLVTCNNLNHNRIIVKAKQKSSWY